jgi:hypothetical protein
MNTKLLNEVHTLARHMRLQQGSQLREGQSLMNALFECNEHLYKQITGTEADCFYVDANISKFWSAVANSVA